MKKLLSTLLVSVLVLALGVAPVLAADVAKEGFPIVTEPLTLTISGPRDSSQVEWAQNKFFQRYAEKTGITLEFQDVPLSGWLERKGLMFAANELPDILLNIGLTPGEIVNYGMNNGQLLAIEELMKEWMPNFMALCEQYPNILPSITAPDGHIYTIPCIVTSDPHSMDFKQFINSAWLAKSGLPMPETTDQFVEVLKYFRDNDMDGDGDATNEIPFAFRDVWAPNKTLAASWGLGKQMNYQINIVDGKVDIWLDNDEYKDFMMFLNTLNNEGLLWSDWYKRDLPAWRANLANGVYGAFNMPFTDVFINRELDYEALLPLTGPTGVKAWSDANSITPTKGAYALSVDCKAPEAALRWVDYFFSEEGSTFYRFGVEGENYYIGEDGKPYLNDAIMQDPRGLLQAYGEFSLIPGVGNGNAHWISNQNNSADATKHLIAIAAQFVPYLPEVYYPEPIFDAETNDRISVIAADINTYRDESLVRFVMGEVGFDQWDKYVEAINQMGLKELEAAYQAALDRMIAK